MKTVIAPIKHEKAFQEMLLARGVEDTRGVGLLRALMACARLLEVIADHDLQEVGLSMPRMRLLFWLHAKEQRGDMEGISPSQLSHYQHISKNTVSSLLASLEEQGLIERALSSEDKRSFQIRLTQAGRTLVHTTLPKHGSFLTKVFSTLTAEEQKTLAKSLHKLRESLIKQVEQCDLGSYKTSPE